MIPSYIPPVLVAVAALLAVAAMIISLSPSRRVRKIPLYPPRLMDGGKGVSVVLLAPDVDDRLSQSIDALLDQDYDDFEIVVVCSATKETVGAFSSLYEADGRVRFTFLPPGSRNVNRGKMALTIGVKGASKEYVLATSTACHVPSRYWLSLMMNPVNTEGKSLVIGITHYLQKDVSRLVAAYRSFCRTLSISSWVAAASRGKAYRADIRNLVFSRDIFFSNKGFASNVTLQVGEEDIFISEVATPTNTAVVLAPDAVPMQDWGGWADGEWRQGREREVYARHFLRKGPFLRQGFLSLSQWLVILLILCASLLTFPSWQLPPAAGAVLLIFWLLQCLSIRGAARHIGEPFSWLTPFFILWHPFDNLLYGFRARRDFRRHELPGSVRRS